MSHLLLPPRPPRHAVGVSLGDGWYAQKTVHVGKPELLFRLAVEFTDGSTQVSTAHPPRSVSRLPIAAREGIHSTSAHAGMCTRLHAIMMPCHAIPCMVLFSIVKHTIVHTYVVTSTT